ncbi:hypothetical protein [Waltera sp.]|uniref:hypothetical protein n=1 Tax=Waltera sp. TaxID=2815806 RepID=UPI00307C6C7E
MNPNDLLVGSVLDIPGKIASFFQTILDMITSVLSALQTLYTTLQDFDNMIINMTDTNGSSQFSGMPVVEAIGTFRYLVGDVAFYMIYLTVLFGCLWTIYVLVTKLYEAMDALISQVTGYSVKENLSSLLTKLIK